MACPRRLWLLMAIAAGTRSSWGSVVTSRDPPPAGCFTPPPFLAPQLPCPYVPAGSTQIPYAIWLEDGEGHFGSAATIHPAGSQATTLLLIDSLASRQPGGIGPAELIGAYFKMVSKILHLNIVDLQMQLRVGRSAGAGHGHHGMNWVAATSDLLGTGPRVIRVVFHPK